MDNVSLHFEDENDALKMANAIRKRLGEGH
jgi:hypothetical protein